MSVEIFSAEKTVCAKIHGDLDHHTAAAIRSEIDKVIVNAPIDTLIIDFSCVTFMDSSGIGLVMGRFRIMNEQGGKVIIAKPPAYIRKVMQLSGISRIAQIVSDYEIPKDDTSKTEEVEKVET